MFREDAARFPVVVSPPVREDAREVLASGGVPNLRSLVAHNGTIWRWNRGCYGVTDGVPHLRIENRILPSGPTVLDEIANAALFYGLMFELPRAYGRIEERLSFEDAKTARLLPEARRELGEALLLGRELGLEDAEGRLRVIHRRLRCPQLVHDG